MDATNANEITQASAQSEIATGETLIVSVADAAAILHVTPQAIRKQIAAGKLNARKVAGAWQIALEPATVEAAATATSQPGAQPRRATSQPVAQSEADQYAAIVAPFLDRLEAQAERIGHLEAEVLRWQNLEVELAAVTAERDQLQASPAPPQNAGSRASEAGTAEPDGGEFPVAASRERTGPFWRSWWESWKRRHP